MLKEEKYFLKDYRAPFKDFDPTKSISNKDMDTNVFPGKGVSPKSRKVFIKPVTQAEKTGPKWGDL